MADRVRDMMTWITIFPGWYEPLLMLEMFISCDESKAMIGRFSDAEGFSDAGIP